MQDLQCYECDEDLYEIMLKNKELFDLSNLPISSKYYCSDNKKLILKFVGLKSKMYSILMKVITKKAQAKVTMLLQSFKNFTMHYLRKKLHRTNQSSNFLRGSFSNRDNVRNPIQFRGEGQPQHLKR